MPLLLSLLAHFQVPLSQLFCPLVLLDLESGLVDVLSALEVALHGSRVGLDVVQLVVQLLLSIQEHLLLHLEILDMQITVVLFSLLCLLLLLLHLNLYSVKMLLSFSSLHIRFDKVALKCYLLT